MMDRDLRGRVDRALDLACDPKVRLPSLGDRPVAVYGAGAMGLRVHHMLAGQGIHPRYFLDRARGGEREVDGIPIFHPYRNELSAAERAGMDVIVAVFNPDADPQEIERILDGAGYGRIVSFLGFYRKFGRFLGAQYWLTEPAFYAAHAEEVRKAATLWADRHSAELFAALIECRMATADDPLPRPSLDDQYFPADLPEDPRCLHYVDCGAYIGDTIAAAFRRRADIASVCAFEPDPENFRRLSAWARAESDELRCPVHLWPCGVGSSTEHRRFAASGAEGSRYEAAGSSDVLCVALDDALHAHLATFIKMDIEGSEPEAIRGARELIARSHPRLAISAYHRPDHLWTLPLLIRELAPACDLHLRLHRFNGFDVVLYALPRL